jgi:hypothetical protein
MKKLFWYFACAIMFAFLLCAPRKMVAQPSPNNPLDPTVTTNLVGSWTNDLKSVLTIVAVDAQSGAITGNYRLNPASGLPPDVVFPLQGWVNTKAPDKNHPNHVTVVSFSVRFGTVGSVTAWNGYYDGSQSILGQWLLSRPNSDYDWDHILAGQDRFRR